MVCAMLRLILVRFVKPRMNLWLCALIRNHPTRERERERKMLIIQGAAEKSGPLNFFAVFSATIWDFNMKFYSFIY